MRFSKLMAAVPGLTARQINYWGEKGWFGPPSSGSGDHRDYTLDDVRLARLACLFIKTFGMDPEPALKTARRIIANHPNNLRLQLDDTLFITFEFELNPEEQDGA